MNVVIPDLLWLGHAGDARSPKPLYDAEISAVIDLAYEEPPASLPRDLVYCRYPLVDGPGNEPWLLRLAIESIERLLRDGTRMLVCCSMGMSRSPTVVAAAMSFYHETSLEEAIESVAAARSLDVDEDFLREVVDVWRLLRDARP